MLFFILLDFDYAIHIDINKALRSVVNGMDQIGAHHGCLCCNIRKKHILLHIRHCFQQSIFEGFSEY
jgi:hypothetical protein